MATKRGRYFYVKRTIRGIGYVEKSLRTRRKGRADALEGMILQLHGRGRLDLVRAWVEGRVSLERLEEAHAAGGLHALTAELGRGDRPTLAAAIEALEADGFQTSRSKKPELAQATTQRHTAALAHLRRFAGGDTDISEVLQTARIRRYRQARRKEKAAKETVNNELVAISILASYALDHGWIEERPRIRKYPREQRIRYLDSGQRALYMAAVRRAFRPQMEFLLWTGVRLHEAEELTSGRLRFEPGGGRALVEDSKTPDGIRVVFFPEWVATTLRREVCDRELGRGDRLFQIPRRTVQAEHARACELAGISDYTIHDHRHTFGVTASQAGTPVERIQQQLGHTRLEQTMIYARFHPDYRDIKPWFERMREQVERVPHESPHEDREASGSMRNRPPASRGSTAQEIGTSGSMGKKGESSDGS